jgi:transposase-like protein
MPDDAGEPLITIAEAARLEGINKSTLSRDVKAGRVRSHDGKVKLSEVREDRARNVDASRAHRRKRPEPPVATEDTARPAGEIAKAVVGRVASRVARNDATRSDATAPDATAPAASNDLITIAEAARAIGINKSTLFRQVQSGAIRSHGGKVRLLEVLEDRANNIDLSKAKPGSAAKAGARGKGAKPDLVGDMLVEFDGTYLPFSQAQAIKETYLAWLRKLEYQKKSGEVVDLAAAEQLFFDMARENRDAWLGWPARVAAFLAADYGVDERLVAEGLTRYVHQHLAELGEPESPEFAAAA